MFNSGFTFNGSHSDDYPYVYVNKIHRPLAAPRTVNLLKIPNRRGAYLLNVDSDVLTLPIDITIKGATSADYESLLDLLNGWLMTDDVQDLILDKSPNRFYKAILDGSTDLDEIVKLGRGTITFVIPDGIKYGAEITQTINDPSGGQANATVINEGTAETFPKITINVDQAKPFLSIVSPDSAIILGNPVTVEETVLDEKQQVFWDQLDTTTNWVNGTDIDDNGVVGGTMSTNGYEFHADSYGINDNGWHGPALVHTLATAITDFEVSVLLAQLNDVAAIGRGEVYLMDINGNELAKIAMRDGHATFKKNYGQVKIGGNLVLNTTGARWDTWNDFDGILTIGRRGKTWYYYIAKIINGKRDSEYYGEWVDEDGLYAADLDKVQLHLGAYEGYAPTNQFFKDVKIYKFNDLTDTQVPNIAQPGDVLEIDMDKRKILRNGKDARYLKDFTSEWFSLKPGSTDLAVYPPDIGKTDITFSSGWL